MVVVTFPQDKGAKIWSVWQNLSLKISQGAFVCLKIFYLWLFLKKKHFNNGTSTERHLLRQLNKCSSKKCDLLPVLDCTDKVPSASSKLVCRSCHTLYFKSSVTGAFASSQCNLERTVGRPYQNCKKATDWKEFLWPENEMCIILHIWEASYRVLSGKIHEVKVSLDHHQLIFPCTVQAQETVKFVLYTWLIQWNSEQCPCELSAHHRTLPRMSWNA